MVANLSAHKAGWDDRWEEFSTWADKGKALMDQLLLLIDEDTNAFNRIMDAFGLPKSSDEEKSIRKKAIQDATQYAIEVPLKVMELCFQSMEVIKAMAENGNPNSVSDAGVGALAARSGVMGAYLNVKINASSLDDKEKAMEYIYKAEKLAEKAKNEEESIFNIVLNRIK
jgi:glutamate formiminotransferase / formiminotetrahydrofolate cyclodeaminase